MQELSSMSVILNALDSDEVLQEFSIEALLSHMEHRKEEVDEVRLKFSDDRLMDIVELVIEQAGIESVLRHLDKIADKSIEAYVERSKLKQGSLWERVCNWMSWI